MDLVALTADAWEVQEVSINSRRRQRASDRAIATFEHAIDLIRKYQLKSAQPFLETLIQGCDEDAYTFKHYNKAKVLLLYAYCRQELWDKFESMQMGIPADGLGRYNVYYLDLLSMFHKHKDEPVLAVECCEQALDEKELNARKDHASTHFSKAMLAEIAEASGDRIEAKMHRLGLLETDPVKLLKKSFDDLLSVPEVVALGRHDSEPERTREVTHFASSQPRRNQNDRAGGSERSGNVEPVDHKSHKHLPLQPICSDASEIFHQRRSTRSIDTTPSRPKSDWIHGNERSEHSDLIRSMNRLSLMSERPHDHRSFSSISRTEASGRSVSRSHGSQSTLKPTPGWSNGTESPWKFLGGFEDIHRGPGSTMRIACSPESYMLATCSSNSFLISIWNLKEGKKYQDLSGHTDTINDLVFGPTSKILVSASSDMTVRVWQAWGAAGVIPITLTGHRARVNTVTVSPDGSIIASASSDETVRLWTVQGTLFATLSHVGAHSYSQFRTSDYRCVAFAGRTSGRYIAASCGADIVIWDEANRFPSFILRGHSGAVVALAAHQNCLVSAGADCTVRFWDVPSRRELRCHETGGSRITDLAISPAKTARLACSFVDGRIDTWDPKTEKIVAVLPGNGMGVNQICYTSCGTMIVGAQPGRFHVWKQWQ